MISMDEAVKRIREHRLERRKQEIPLSECVGTYLAEQVSAPFDSPRFDNSAMDGFAVRWRDVKGAGREEVSLEIVGESRGGEAWEGILGPGEAVRINTGAVLPEGADTVVPVEKCREAENRVIIQSARRAGDHVRRQGESFREGERLFGPGTRIDAAVAGMLGSIGREQAEVYRAPAVTLLVTGSELTAPARQKLGKGQIYDSNRPMLSHYLRAAGVDHVETLRVKDDAAATEEAIREACRSSDIVVSTGGVSVGPHDHVPAAAERAGLRTVFHFVAHKPGKPFFFAAGDEVLYFGLPGNPVSAFMTFTWYLYPELCHYLGNGDPFRTRRAVLGGEVRNDRERSLMLQVRGREKDNAFVIDSVRAQGSHRLLALSRADGFIIVPPSTRWEKGHAVRWYALPG